MKKTAKPKTKSGAGKAGKTRRAKKQSEIGKCVEKSVGRYLHDLNGGKASGVYRMVLVEIEKPLLQVVMRHTGKNQSEASKLLGINRNTLRKKLDQYGLNE